MPKIEQRSRRLGRTAQMRMTLSLCYSGKFSVRKDALLGWYVARGSAMALFSSWENAWHFMFGGEAYPGQAYFHEHNANIKRAEEAAS